MTSPNQTEAIYFSEHDFGSQYTPQELLAELTAEIENEPCLQQCNNIRVLYANSTYSIVPQPLFDETKLSEYLKFNSKILPGDFLVYDELNAHDMNVVYVPLVNINNYFFETFGSFQYFHAITKLIDFVLTQEKHNTATKTFVHVFNNHIDVVAIDNGVLQLCNSYPYKTPEDLGYYVLFALEQLGWSPDAVETVLLGNIAENDANFELLYTYIRNLSLYQNKSAIEIEGLAPQQQLLLKNTKP